MSDCPPSAWLLGTHNEGAFIWYDRDGEFAHAGCAESARVQVNVRLEGVENPRIESMERWSCESCGLQEERDEKAHATLLEALDRMPPPLLPGDLRGEALVEELNDEMAQARREHKEAGLA